MKKITILILATVLFAASPAVAQSKKKLNKLMNSWVNDTKRNLYQSWGPPSRTTSDGENGEILIYSDRVYRSAIYAGNMYVPPVDYYVHKMFFVNSSGTIYAWRWEKNPNPPDRVDMNIHVR